MVTKIENENNSIKDKCGIMTILTSSSQAGLTSHQGSSHWSYNVKTPHQAKKKKKTSQKTRCQLLPADDHKSSQVIYKSQRIVESRE